MFGEVMVATVGAGGAASEAVEIAPHVFLSDAAGEGAPTIPAVGAGLAWPNVLRVPHATHAGHTHAQAHAHAHAHAQAHTQAHPDARAQGSKAPATTEAGEATQLEGPSVGDWLRARGHELGVGAVGKGVGVYMADQGTFQWGNVICFDRYNGKHLIQFEDGSREKLFLNLHLCMWKKLDLPTLSSIA